MRAPIALAAAEGAARRRRGAAARRSCWTRASSAAALDALLPAPRAACAAGLVKSEQAMVDAAVAALCARGRRRALLDRLETGYSVAPAPRGWSRAPGRARVRTAAPRGSRGPGRRGAREPAGGEPPRPLRGRPARLPALGGRSRCRRARVVEREGQHRASSATPTCVATRAGCSRASTPGPRRAAGASRAAGVSALCREAFAAGADHVQLAVVEGNDAGASASTSAWASSPSRACARSFQLGEPPTGAGRCAAALASRLPRRQGRRRAWDCSTARSRSSPARAAASAASTRWPWRAEGAAVVVNDLGGARDGTGGGPGDGRPGRRGDPQRRAARRRQLRQRRRRSRAARASSRRRSTPSDASTSW